MAKNAPKTPKVTPEMEAKAAELGRLLHAATKIAVDLGSNKDSTPGMVYMALVLVSLHRAAEACKKRETLSPLLLLADACRQVSECIDQAEAKTQAMEAAIRNAKTAPTDINHN